MTRVDLRVVFSFASSREVIFNVVEDSPIFFVLIALMIGGFQVFISVLLMTGGGPLHRTEVALTYMFDEAFGNLNFGYGAALSYVLAVVIVIVSAAQSKFFGRGDQDLEY